MDYRCKGKQNWWHHTQEVRRCRGTKETEKGNVDFNGNEGMESGEGQGSKGERDLMQTEPRAPVEAEIMLERAMIGRFTKRPEKETAWILNALKSALALVQKVASDCPVGRYLPKDLFRFTLQKGEYTELRHHMARFPLRRNNNMPRELAI